MKSATNMKSFSVKPLVVRAGVPMRMPPGTIALLSPITVQLDQVRRIMTQKCSENRNYVWTSTSHRMYSPGTEFLLRVMDAMSRIFST